MRILLAWPWFAICALAGCNWRWRRTRAKGCTWGPGMRFCSLLITSNEETLWQSFAVLTISFLLPTMLCPGSLCWPTCLFLASCSLCCWLVCSLVATTGCPWWSRWWRWSWPSRCKSEYEDEQLTLYSSSTATPSSPSFQNFVCLPPLPLLVFVEVWVVLLSKPLILSQQMLNRSF